MPEGIEVLVEDGFATIDFVDPALKGVGLAALLEHTPPEFIEPMTRTGPRKLYRVPEGNAREAGFIDKASRVDELEAPDTSSAGDGTGMVLPGVPTSANIHAQVVRSGRYSDAYAEGGQVGFAVEGRLGEWAEVSGDGSGTALPDADPSTLADDAKPIEPLPDIEWGRPALNAYAAKHGVEHPEKLPNKAAVLAALEV